MAKAYGVLSFTHLFANRVTFVIDKDGIIRHIDEGSDAIDPSGAVQACSLPGKKQAVSSRHLAIHNSTGAVS